MISKISLIHISLSLSLSLLKLRNIEKLIYQKYLKILDLTTLFIADAPIKKTNKISFTSSQSTLKYGSKNRPWPKGLKQKKLLNNLLVDTVAGGGDPVLVDQRPAAPIQHQGYLGHLALCSHLAL